MSIASLATKWREEADAMDRSAKNYKRSCVEAKAAQLILLAKQLRQCADEVDRVCCIISDQSNIGGH